MQTIASRLAERGEIARGQRRDPHPYSRRVEHCGATSHRVTQCSAALRCRCLVRRDPNHNGRIDFHRRRNHVSIGDDHHTAKSARRHIVTVPFGIESSLEDFVAIDGEDVVIGLLLSGQSDRTHPHCARESESPPRRNRRANPHVPASSTRRERRSGRVPTASDLGALRHPLVHQSQFGCEVEGHSKNVETRTEIGR